MVISAIKKWEITIDPLNNFEVIDLVVDANAQFDSLSWERSVGQIFENCEGRLCPQTSKCVNNFV